MDRPSLPRFWPSSESASYVHFMQLHIPQCTIVTSLQQLSLCTVQMMEGAVSTFHVIKGLGRSIWTHFKCSSSSGHLYNVSNDVHPSERDWGKLARECHKKRTGTQGELELVTSVTCLFMCHVRKRVQSLKPLELAIGCTYRFFLYAKQFCVKHLNWIYSTVCCHFLCSVSFLTQVFHIRRPHYALLTATTHYALQSSPASNVFNCDFFSYNIITYFI